MLCINKRLYWSYRGRRSHRSYGSHWLCRSYWPGRGHGSHWSYRSRRLYRSYGSHRSGGNRGGIGTVFRLFHTGCSGGRQCPSGL